MSMSGQSCLPDPLAEARRALHLNISCVTCGAGFSEPCRSTSGKVLARVHAKRSRGGLVQGELFAVSDLLGTAPA